MTVKERIAKEVEEVIRAELRGTIPPSIDVMRNIAFENAAKKSVDVCIIRIAEAVRDELK